MNFYVQLFLSFAVNKIVYSKPMCNVEMKEPKPWDEYILWENRYERSPDTSSTSRDVKNQKEIKKIPSGRASYKKYVKKNKKYPENYDRTKESDN